MCNDARSNRLMLNDILYLSDEQISRGKVRFNRNNGCDDPIELFKTNPDVINNQWFLWRSSKRNYFSVGDLALCLVKISGDYWLLTTIKTITRDNGVHDGIAYEGDEHREYQSLYGRLVVKFHKSFESSVVTLSRYLDQLEVDRILPDVFEDDHFPGYDSVRLSYAHLKRILDVHIPDWIAALSNQKAVYVITDTAAGKLYVGSATGENGLLQRWTNYIDNGHGGDVDLIALEKERGFDYIKQNFQYSLLENYNDRVDDKYVLSRESWWKVTLDTRAHGYNSN